MWIDYGFPLLEGKIQRARMKNGRQDECSSGEKACQSRKEPANKQTNDRKHQHKKSVFGQVSRAR